MQSSRRFRRLATFGLLSLASSVILFESSSALAASLKINLGGITRVKASRTDPVTRNWISLAECLQDDVFTFPLILADYGGTDLEVWVSEGTGDCTDRAARTTTAATCWRVHKETPTTNVPNVRIRVQDIAAKDKPPQHDLSIGTADDCRGTTSAAQGITLFFMLVQSLDNVGGEKWTTSLDLVGPSAPTGLSVGSGNSILSATWNQNADTDVAGYRFFCDPPPGSVTSPDNTFGPGSQMVDAGGQTGSTCPDASADLDASFDPDAEDAGIDDAGDEPACVPDAAGGGGGGGGGPVITACGATFLSPGVIPDPDFVAKYSCGERVARGTQSTLIKGLTNFQPTNVAVAAVDAVDNPGALSELACGLPEPVDGFDEVYRRAGGMAGSGFCSMRHPRQGEGARFWAPAMLAGIALFRRRRSRTRL